MKSKICLAGMIFSILQLGLNLYFIFIELPNNTIHSEYLKSTEFGGDFNTYQYRSARSNAITVTDIGYLIKNAMIFISATFAVLAVIEFMFFALKYIDNKGKEIKNEIPKAVPPHNWK